MGEPRALEDVRRENIRRYGPEPEARAYAEEIGGEYCPRCGAVHLVLPEYLDGGHQCLTDGTDRIFLLNEVDLGAPLGGE